MNSDKMDTMLIRIAKAIAKSEGDDNWQAHMVSARACLEVLREPSQAMLEAATPGLPDWGDLPSDWRAMIDHVLGEHVEMNDNEIDLRQNRVIG